jgi:hypothetical protein
MAGFTTPMPGMPQPPDQGAPIATSPDMLPPAPQGREPHQIALQKLKARVAQLVQQHQAGLRQANPAPVPPAAMDQPGGDAQMRHGGLPGVTTVAPAVSQMDYAAYPDSSTYERGGGVPPYRVPTNRLSPPDMQVRSPLEAQSGHTDYTPSGRGFGTDAYANSPDQDTGARPYRAPGFNAYQPGIIGEIAPLRTADGSAGPRSVAEEGHINALLEGEHEAADRASAAKPSVPPQMRGEVPFYGRNDEYIPRPAATPGGREYQWPLDPLNHPVNSLIGGALGALEASGMRGGPIGGLSGLPGIASKFTEPAKYALENVPKAPAALATGLTGALAATSEGGETSTPASESVAPTAENLQRLYEQRATLSRQVDDARNRREAERKTGQGPNFNAADQEFQRQSNRLDALDRTIQEEQHRGSPEYALEMQQKAADAARAAQEKRASTPTRELFSDYMPYLPAVTIPAAVLGGAALRGRSMSNFAEEIGDISQRWAAAVQRAQTARPGSNAAQAAATEARGLQGEYEALRRTHEGWFNPGRRNALMWGAGLGFEQAFLPEEVDFARAAMGSPLWGTLKRDLLDNYQDALKRGAGAMALGGTAAELGALGTEMFGGPIPPGYGPATSALPQPRLPRPPGPGPQPQPPPQVQTPNPAPQPPNPVAPPQPPGNPVANQAAPLPPGHRQTPWGIRGARGRFTTDPR